MKVIEISKTSHIKSFHQLPFSLYKDSQAWIPHVYQEVEDVFAPTKNPFFKHGTAKRWIVLDAKGSCIGRIAAFVNKKRAFDEFQPTGGIGFFESQNNQALANLLFNTAKNWLEEQGMKAMDGPINFGERNKYWGLLIDGYEHPPNYGNNYHLPYYKDLFESYGFKIYFKQYCFKREAIAPLPEKYERIAASVLRNPNYAFKPMNAKRFYAYAEEFQEVYNQAWQTHDNFKPMRLEQARKALKTMKPILDPRAVWFAYFKGKPVGFLIFLPDINPIIKKINGNMNLWGKLRFLIEFKLNKPKNLWAVVFGFHPEHQKKGLEAGLFQEIKNHFGKNPPYEEIFISWIGSFNPKMLHINRSLGSKHYQTLATYRHIFDPSIPFKPCPSID